MFFNIIDDSNASVPRRMRSMEKRGISNEIEREDTYEILNPFDAADSRVGMAVHQLLDSDLGFPDKVTHNHLLLQEEIIDDRGFVPDIEPVPECTGSPTQVIPKSPSQLSCSNSSISSASTKGKKPRNLVSSAWNKRFQELIKFREENDHCFVPHTYPPNPKLSQWVRKQRNQRKRKEKGLHSTLTDEREDTLTNAGFIWDSHRAQWQERYQSLEVFQMTYGHCNVPSTFHDTSLVNWVKNQRKQFKLYRSGCQTTMTDERAGQLKSLGFNWNPRNL